MIYFSKYLQVFFSSSIIWSNYDQKSFLSELPLVFLMSVNNSYTPLTYSEHSNSLIILLYESENIFESLLFSIEKDINLS